jgi:CRISPR/Cas system-associated protein Cas10 (large subunit of type III CRISPR-Cas system)
MHDESTNLHLNDEESDDPDDSFHNYIECDNELCEACVHVANSIQESEAEIGQFLARFAAKMIPENKMCGICKSLSRAIVSLYENRENEPEGLLVASALLSLQAFHSNDAEIMAKDILSDIIEQMNNMS